MAARKWLDNGYIMFSKFLDGFGGPELDKMGDDELAAALKRWYHFSEEEAARYVKQFGSRVRRHRRL